MPNDEPQYDQLPQAIIDALRELDGPAVLPDRQRDHDVLSGARLHFATAGLSRKRRNLRLFFAGGGGGAIAAAAMVALVVYIGNPLSEPNAAPDLAQTSPNSPQPTAARSGDLDANGTLDILDAYALAKHIERGDSAKAYDFNHDGRIDQFDIDLLANRAVALNTGERG